MARFLIEVPHENKKEACRRAVQVFLDTGSHYVTNADWGCGDDEHKAWIVVDMDSKDEALAILPPLFRQDAKIIALEKFNKDDLEGYIETHDE
ncbi:MAG: hypothetical protein MUO58_11470 [Anaerolineales bacterium]|nr:hypothetical protein [Anaerolineales bacterium]